MTVVFEECKAPALRLAAGACLLFLSSSCGPSRMPMTQMTPKLYDDAQVIQLANKSGKAIAAIDDSLTPFGISEVTGIRSANRIDLAAGAAPAGTAVNLPAAPDVALPERLDFAPAIPAGMHMEELVRRKTDLLAYELLFQGDSDAISPEKEVSLIRIDLSLGGYQDLGTDHRQFAFACFKVIPDDATNAGDFRLYMLAPEMSSVLAKESVVNATFASVAASVSAPIAGGAANAAGTGRLQSALEEAFGSLYQRPMQFALYGDQPLTAGFGFGPQRKVIERGIFERLFLFKRRYAMHYEITPGPRDCYIAVVHPRGATFSLVRASKGVLVSEAVWPEPAQPPVAILSSAEPEPSDTAPKTDTARTEPKSEPGGADRKTDMSPPNGSSSGRTSLTVLSEEELQATVTNAESALRGWMGEGKLFSAVTFKPAKNAPAKSTEPVLVAAKGSSTAVITLPPRFTAIGARVFIGAVEIPQANIDLLSRWTMRLVIPADSRYVDYASAGMLGLRVVSRAGDASETFACRLVAVADQVLPELVIPTPRVVGVGELVTFKASPEHLDMKSLKKLTFNQNHSVVVGGPGPDDKVVFDVAKNTATVKLPKIDTAPRIPIKVELEFPGLAKPVTIMLETR